MINVTQSLAEMYRPNEGAERLDRVQVLEGGQPPFGETWTWFRDLNILWLAGGLTELERHGAMGEWMATKRAAVGTRSRRSA